MSLNSSLLVRRYVGVEPHRGHLTHVEIELFAGDLQQAGRIPLTELAFAEIERGGVVGMDRDPRVDRDRVGRPGEIATGGEGR